jgi:hypothetical protein
MDMRGLEPSISRGRGEIADSAAAADAYGDFAVERVSDVIGSGNYAATYEIFHGTGG